MRDRIIFTSIFSFLVGVFLCSIFLISPNMFWLFGLVSVLLLLLFFFTKKNVFILISLGIASLLLGVIRFHFVDVNQPRAIFDELIGTEITFEGVIVNEPDRRENSQRLITEFNNIQILVSTELYPEFSYGDKIEVRGELSRPKNFKTDIGKEFDYVHYLEKDGIFYMVSFAEVSLIDSGHGNTIKSFLYKIKNKFLQTIEHQIESPKSSLLGGLLLGTKQSLGESLQESFIKTGLVHIVVLSGYNVTIIAEAIMRVLSFLPLTTSVLVGSLSIVFFALMTGAGATIVRASIMAILALIARATGNGYEIGRALVVAGFLMVLQNPYILYFDISFQLSFLATLGLIYLSPLFKKFFLWLPEKYGLQDIASATMATQVFVLPFLLYKMGILSIIAPITNILILPLVPMTMLFGFLTGLVGLISTTLAFPFAFISEMLLSFEILIVEFFAKLPFSSVTIKSFPFILVILIYIFIFWILYKHNKMKSNEPE